MAGDNNPEGDSGRIADEQPAAEIKNSIEDFVAGLLRTARRQKRGLLSAELHTRSALADFASAATQIHAALVSVRTIHAVLAAANCLGAVRQLMDQLSTSFAPTDLKQALSTPPGPRLKQEIAQVAAAFFEKAEGAALELRDPLWFAVIKEHGDRATTGIVDYCQRLADQHSAGLSMPKEFQREIHVSLTLLAGLRAAPS